MVEEQKLNKKVTGGRAKKCKRVEQKMQDVEQKLNKKWTAPSWPSMDCTASVSESRHRPQGRFIHRHAPNVQLRKLVSKARFGQRCDA
jgi:hypothetical protein